MEFKKPDKKAIKSWRIGEAIALGVILLITIPLSIYLAVCGWESFWKYVIMGGLILLALYQIVALTIFPQIEYKQWGYLVEEDKVIIRHGIFFVKQTVIPIIRIQNITISQGPVNRALGLYKVEMALASGSFEIQGLDQETADGICENLKNRLYDRVSEKGVL